MKHGFSQGGKKTDGGRSKTRCSVVGSRGVTALIHVHEKDKKLHDFQSSSETIKTINSRKRRAENVARTVKYISAQLQEARGKNTSAQLQEARGKNTSAQLQEARG